MPVRQHGGVPKHQWIEKMENIAKRVILWFRDFSERTHNCLVQRKVPKRCKISHWSLFPFYGLFPSLLHFAVFFTSTRDSSGHGGAQE